MAHGSSFDDDQEITGINVTPLVDVMLVLLVIFMMTTSYITQQSIQVNLPKASPEEKASVASEESLVFTLDKQSRIFFQDKELHFEGISGILATKASKTKQVTINADEKTPYESVIKLMDGIRQNGVFEFSLSIRN